MTVFQKRTDYATRMGDQYVRLGTSFSLALGTFNG